MSTGTVGRPPTALVIEDDDTIGRHLESGLRGNGYSTTWCRTGSAGLTAAHHDLPDLVLLDLGLPDLDGIDLARRLREDLPELLIVILTARTDEIDVIAGLDAGADDYLVKPFSMTVLLARLRAHLRRRAPPRHSRRASPSGWATSRSIRRPGACWSPSRKLPCGRRSSNSSPNSPGIRGARSPGRL